MRYNAVFEPCEEGGFVVTVSKLPGLVTEGDTYEEALKNTEDAMKMSKLPSFKPKKLEKLLRKN